MSQDVSPQSVYEVHQVRAAYMIISVVSIGLLPLLEVSLSPHTGAHVRAASTDANLTLERSCISRYVQINNIEM